MLGALRQHCECKVDSHLSVTCQFRISAVRSVRQDAAQISYLLVQLHNSCSVRLSLSPPI
jgi:hypothetical protein